MVDSDLSEGDLGQHEPSSNAEIVKHIMSNILMFDAKQIATYKKNGIRNLNSMFRYGPTCLLDTKLGFDHKFPDDQVEVDNHSLKVFIMYIQL